MNNRRESGQNGPRMGPEWPEIREQSGRIEVVGVNEEEKMQSKMLGRIGRELSKNWARIG